MRRRDKEITDKKEIESILERATVCRVALCLDGIPYVVPLSFGCRDNCLYFHSAPEGRKIDMIRQNNNVCFELDTDEGIAESESACNWSVKYRSVIGYGRAYLVEDLSEKRKALGVIVSHYSDRSHEFAEESIDGVAVIKVEIDSITGKKSGF